jgi:hypothetical protein
MKARLVIVTVIIVVGLASSAQGYISRPDALNATFNYAHHVCNQHQSCKRYGANRCIRHSGGISCQAWLYIIRQPNRKLACRRLVFWKSRYNRQFLSDWRCFAGWNRGPYG